MTEKLQNVAAVFFDAGNTLIYPDYFVIQEVLSEFGIESTIVQIRHAEYDALSTAQKLHGTQAWKAYFGAWMKKIGTPENRIKDIYSELWIRHRKKHLWSVPDEHAVETLSTLQDRGYKLGVISNSDGSIEQLLQDCHLAHYFETIADSAVVGVRKPDAKIFEVALERLFAQPSESVFIGDSYETDVLGAQSTGMTAILFDPLKKFSHLNCMQINRLIDLLELLL